MQDTVLTFIRKNALLNAGDRVGVAVSGGADSVALLLALMGLREELGLLLSVIHFNHQIRGEAADADERFVIELSEQHGLEIHRASGDAPARAREKKQSLETAARELRYAFFRQLISAGVLDKIATAHTIDDQAESVLMRFLRGAGTRGLAGIYPEKKEGSGSIVRPLLGVRRSQVEAFLNDHKQVWREDATNADRSHTRNKVRHDLLPLLARDFNPAIVETLARASDVARAEEQYWESEAARLLPFVLLPGKAVRGGGRATGTRSQSAGLSLEALKKQPLAIQRILIRAAAESLGIELDLAHVDELLAIASGTGKACELPDGWRAQRSLRELRFEKSQRTATPEHSEEHSEYEQTLAIPGECLVPGRNLVVHTQLLPVAQEDGAYNHGEVPDRLFAKQADNVTMAGSGSAAGQLQLLCGEGPKQLESLGFLSGALTLRSWRAGDRFRPAHCGSEKKVKELLQDLKVPQAERSGWPVIAAGERLIWVRGTRPLNLWVSENGSLQRLLIDVRELPVTG